MARRKRLSKKEAKRLRVAFFCNLLLEQEKLQKKMIIEFSKAVARQCRAAKKNMKTSMGTWVPMEAGLTNPIFNAPSKRVEKDRINVTIPCREGWMNKIVGHRVCVPKHKKGDKLQRKLAAVLFERDLIWAPKAQKIAPSFYQVDEVIAPQDQKAEFPASRHVKGGKQVLKTRREDRRHRGGGKASKRRHHVKVSDNKNHSRRNGEFKAPHKVARNKKRNLKRKLLLLDKEIQAPRGARRPLIELVTRKQEVVKQLIALTKVQSWADFCKEVK